MLPSPPDRSSTVSVILPTYQSGAFVGRAIDSVLRQEGRHVHELILIDDCSLDDTAVVIRSRYGADPRVKLLSTERNGGAGVARNVGIAAASGEWIALIDADDAWAPDRLSRLMGLCTADVDLLFDNLILFDNAEGRVTETMFASLPNEIDVARMVAERITQSAFNYGYLKPLIRRSFLERTGITYPEVRVSEDLLFYLELLIRRPKTRATSVAAYIYTTPISASSGRRSDLSTSHSNDLLVARMLEDLLREHGDRLTLFEIEAISRRAKRLRQSAPLTRLHDYWTRHRYLSFLFYLLTDSRARRSLVRKLRERNR